MPAELSDCRRGSAMVHIRLVPKAEAQQTRRPKQPGVRKQRMNEFDAYVRMLLDSPGEAAVYEDIEGSPQNFVLSLRSAFQRAGVTAVVRKMRDRNEVRAWLAGSDALDESSPELEAMPTGPALEA